MKKNYRIIISLIILILLFLILVLYDSSIKPILNILCDITINNEILLDILFSIKRILIWFTMASLLWVWLAIFLWRSKRFRFLKYFFEIIRPIPPIARIPLAILRFWLWDASSYFIVFVWSFFPIFTNTYFWITSIPQIYLDVSKNMEFNKFDFYYKILWKYSLPYIFSWLKIWLWMWWMSLIAAELIWAQSWLGYYIQINRLLLNMENVVLWMIIIGTIWFWLNYWLSKIETFLVRRK